MRNCRKDQQRHLITAFSRPGSFFIAGKNMRQCIQQTRCTVLPSSDTALEWSEVPHMDLSQNLHFRTLTTKTVVKTHESSEFYYLQQPNAIFSRSLDPVSHTQLGHMAPTETALESFARFDPRFF